MNAHRHDSSLPSHSATSTGERAPHVPGVPPPDAPCPATRKTNRWFAALVAVCGLFILATLIYLVAAFQPDTPRWVRFLVEHFPLIVGVLTAITLLCAALGLREDRRQASAEYEARMRQWHQRLQAAQRAAVPSPQSAQTQAPDSDPRSLQAAPPRPAGTEETEAAPGSGSQPQEASRD